MRMMPADSWGGNGSGGGGEQHEDEDEDGVDEVLAAQFTAAADIVGGGGGDGGAAARQQDNENKGRCQGQCQVQGQQAKRKSKKAHENGNGNPNAAGIPPQTQTQRGPSQCSCPGPANNPNLRPSIRPYVDGHHQSCFSPSPREREYYDDGVDLIPLRPLGPRDTTAVPVSIPFSTAARKLQATLSRSIAFFKTFYRDFRAETRALGGYADTTLMNRAWRRKIRNSEEYIGPVNNRRSRRGQNEQEGSSGAGAAGNNHGSTNNSNDSGNHGGNNNNHERMWAAAATQPDLRTFSELQREVIDRVTALYHAKLPQARILRRPTDRHSLTDLDLGLGSLGEEVGDEEGGNPTDRRILEEWNMALTLKRHVRDSFGRVVRAVKDMDRNYMAVTQAMRELEMLQRDLVIYRRGWDERVCYQGVSTDDGGGGEWDGGRGEDELGVGGGHEDQGAPEEGGQDDQGEQK
ncbi:uncharacterized protein HMPREF1120_05354 [Exophiala dermatitidis NIH/UT8656]|uniref:Uncharacterized protein n=2 Tax=Exophiala dermatitidis TaxID=5970 RepID=H6C0X4_EXODN|nr:uncharacterized protein HMPREF1120_05354 [Exophiala dermatitidis NIH/UT8656]EHY57312.1 hypothetical protein HMPREF1120_05354 [Exophiala dermatitidis NIH/UT8656]KAJ4516792.1 hypothetical protein HRR75_003452 [Exophiala dermatitidis]